MEYLRVITIFYFFIQLTDSSYASKESSDCQPPRDPLYGSYEIKRKSYVPEDIITFSCQSNTYLFGSKYLICQDGRWNSTVPICVTSTAEKLTMAENQLNYLTDGNYTTCFDGKKKLKFEFKYDGSNPEIILKLVHDQTKYKPRPTEKVKMNNKECTEIRTYQSNEGKKILVCYEFKCLASVKNSNDITLYDSLRRICEIEIFWEKNFTCLHLYMDPSRGSIRYENNLGRKEAVYSSAAIYECNPGHKLLGPSVRYCTEYGRWSGNETTCIIIGCGNYSSISNGRITYTNKSTNGIARLQCNEGYKPKFKAVGDVFSICQPNGSWTFVPFECQEVFCFKSPSSTKGMEWILEKRPAPVGHKARVQCYPGYAMFGGPLLIECLQNGNWSETTAICKNIASLTNTKMIAIAALIGAGSSAVIFSIIICIIIFKKRLKRGRQPKDPNSSNTHTRLNTYQADGNEYFAIVYEEVPPVKAKKPNSPLPKVPSCETEFNYSLPIDQNKESEKENRYTYSQPQDAFQLPSDKSLKRRHSSAGSTYWRECNYFDDKSDVFKPSRLNSNSSLPDISITKSLLEDLYSSD